MVNKLSYDQKNAKAQQIKDAAWQLFTEQPFDNISIAMIAQTAHVGKGTIFNYFKTKEDVFMALLLGGYQKYFAEVLMRFEASDVTTKAALKEFLLAETHTLITEHATLIRLNSLRGAQLEVHASQEQTENSRQELHTIHEHLGQAIATKVSKLDAMKISHIFVIQSAIINGLMNLDGLDEFNHVGVNANLPIFQIKLVPEACQILGYYIDGILMEESNGNQ